MRQSWSNREAIDTLHVTLIMKVSITFKLQQSWSTSLFINSLNQSWSNCETIVKQSWSNRESIMKQSRSNHEATPFYLQVTPIMKQFVPPWLLKLIHMGLDQAWSNREAIVKQSWSNHEATPFYLQITPIMTQFVPSWLLKPIHMGLHQPWSTSKCGIKAAAFPPLFFCGWVIVPAKDLSTPLPYLWYTNRVLVPKKKARFLTILADGWGQGRLLGQVIGPPLSLCGSIFRAFGASFFFLVSRLY